MASKNEWTWKESSLIEKVLILAGGGVVAYIAITKITDALNASANVVGADNQDECVTSCSDSAQTAVNNKSWWRSKTAVYNESFDSCMAAC